MDMLCDRCFKETEMVVKVPHPRFKDGFLLFCPKCAEETGTKGVAIKREVNKP